MHRETNGIHGQSNPVLTIVPPGEVHAKPLHSSFFFTCKADVEQENQVQDLKWISPTNEEIPEVENRSLRVYTEDVFDGVGKNLFFLELLQNDTGTYQCTARYAGNLMLEASVRIDPYLPITWVDAPTEQYATAEQQGAKITCIVRANPSATVDWHRKGKVITTGYGNQRFRVTSEGIIINGVKEEDEGAYTCRALVSETGELQETVINFAIYRAPEWVQEPEDVTGTEGEALEIECIAKGRPDPTYKWINDENANLHDKDGYSVDKYGKLKISRLSRFDEGLLTCVAENDANNGRIEKQIKLTVNIRPQIVEYQNVSIPTDKVVSIECKANGKPLPKIEFRKLSNAEPFVAGAQPRDHRITVKSTEQGDVTVGTLTITNTLRTDDGLYGCWATNEGGQAYRNGHIEVQFAPSFHSMSNRLQYNSWEGKPVNLSCIAEAIPNATYTWYLRTDQEIRPGQDPNLRIVRDKDRSILQVTPADLIYYTQYRCVARNIHGYEASTMELKEAYPPGRIDQAIPKIVTANTITWEFVGPREDHGMETNAYVVQFKKRGGSSWERASTKVWPVGTLYIVEDLEPSSTYDFQFAARNSVGQGQWSEKMAITMREEGPPLRPTILDEAKEEGFKESSSSDRYELRWQVPQNNGEEITEFEIFYYEVDPLMQDGRIIRWNKAGSETRKSVPHPGRLMYVLERLRPDTYYKIELRARNVIGPSEPDTLVIRTGYGKHVGAIRQASASVSTGVIIGIIVVILVLALVVIDIVRYKRSSGKKGVLATCLAKSKSHRTKDKAANSNDAVKPEEENMLQEKHAAAK
ncbi:unnamed protein product [Cyprideis torosa]|uniref:Uncharacterized protein n=1 Tax=Cyprideis torosa TaxID=163714 RepID=A0A7R8W0T2_9CRUS|nr:unnamed protein product [Cyprideis torosa]CAG0880129.1 unnamed protein product [Cyprideis torosa]